MGSYSGWLNTDGAIHHICSEAMPLGITLPAGSYPKGTLTISRPNSSGLYFQLNAGLSSATFKFNLYLCDSAKGNKYLITTIELPGSSAWYLGSSGKITATMDAPNLNGKALYVIAEAVNNIYSESFYVRNEKGPVTVATYEIPFSISTAVSPSGSGTLSASASSAINGTSITLTPSPATGYSLSSYTKSPTSLTISNNKFTMPAQNVSVTANFTKNNYSVSTSVETSGTGTLSTNKSTAQMGDTVTLTPSPATGYQFSTWSSKTPSTLSINSSNQFTMPAQNVSVTARFTKRSFTLTTTVSPSGGGSVTAGGTIEYGGTKSLTATPATGYSFSSWSKTAGTLSSTTAKTTTFTMGTSAATVTANFTKNSYTLTTTVSPSGGGSVTAGGSIQYGSTKSLTASPASGYSFSKWTATSGSLSTTTAATTTFTMGTSNSTVTATFTKNTYSITCSVGPSGGGTLTANRSTATIGDTVTLTPTASTGYRFTGYSKSPTSLNIANNAFTMPASNVTVTANFEKIVYTVSSSVSPDGSGTVSCSPTSATYGDTVTITKAGLTGYEFDHYSTTPSLTITNDTFSMPASNVTLTAYFVRSIFNVNTATSPSGAGTITLSAPSGEAGDTIRATQTPSPGYLFSGWTSSPTVEIDENGDFTMPAQDVTITANYFAASASEVEIEKTVLVAGETVGITIIPGASRFSHKYKISFGEGMDSGWIDVVTGVTEASYTVPISWSSGVPSGVSYTGGTIELQSYDGSLLVGANSINGLTLVVPDSVQPSLANVSVSVARNVDGIVYADIGNYYVQNHSGVRVQCTATGVYGSTITRYRVQIPQIGFDKTQSGPVLDMVSDLLATPGTMTIEVTAYDSRGRVAVATTSINVEAYNAPNGSVIVWRVNENNVADPDGVYAKCSITKTYTALGTNSLTWMLISGEQSITNPEDVCDVLPGDRKTFEPESTDEIVLRLTDSFETVEVSSPLLVAQYVI